MRHEFPSMIALDLDDTLYNYPRADSAGLIEAGKVLKSRLGIEYKDWQIEYDWAKHDVKQRIGNSGSGHSRLLYFKTMLELLGVGGHFDLILQLENAYWQSFLRAISPALDSKEFLEVCRARGLPVVIMSDLTLGIQLRKILQLGFLTFIHAVVTSEELGADKPNSGFLKYASDNLGLDTSQVWVVGDDRIKDRGLAEAVGADFFHVSASGKSDFNFRQLISYLSR